MNAKIALLVAFSTFLLQGFSLHAAAPLPSAQLKPILEPCLDAILSPLQNNTSMPRVQVETLRADFAASMVTADTAAEKRVYQNAVEVCNAMTSDMDARANAQTQAKTSSEMPTLSTGGDIDESMPMRGWDAGGAGNAIRKKQKQDRKDANKKAQRQSAFVNSSGYNTWVNNAPELRELVMGLYTRQMELEALYEKSIAAAAPSPGTTADTGKTKNTDESTQAVGTWKAHKGRAIIWNSPDHTATRLTLHGLKETGTWSVDDKGNWHGVFPTANMSGAFSDNGQSLTTAAGTVYKLTN
jgi:hypothetical protein